jgi:3-oxoadipate enol-lactonase
VSALRSDAEAHEGYLRQLEARAAHDTFSRLSSLRMPVLIVGGRYDGQAAPENQQALQAQIPHGQLEFFTGGHGFLWEDPHAFEVVGAFLADENR